jgi:hypothetical protein
MLMMARLHERRDGRSAKGRLRPGPWSRGGGRLVLGCIASGANQDIIIDHRELDPAARIGLQSSSIRSLTHWQRLGKMLPVIPRVLAAVTTQLAILPP